MSTTEQSEFVTATGVRWDDPEEGKTWLVSLIGIVVLCALVIFLSVVFFRAETTEVEQKVVDKSWEALQTAKRAQLDLLTQSNTYAVEVGGKQLNRQRIPITQAMEKLAADPRMAAPAAGSSAAAAPATAPAAKP